jgi:protein-tyrosine phosphatase
VFLVAYKAHGLQQRIPSLPGTIPATGFFLVVVCSVLAVLFAVLYGHQHGAMNTELKSPIASAASPVAEKKALPPTLVLDSGFLYLGCKEDARNASYLEEKGIRAIVNVAVQDGFSNQNADKDIDYLGISVYDSDVPGAEHSDISVGCVCSSLCSFILCLLCCHQRHFGDAVRFISERVKAEKPVLVHCWWAVASVCLPMMAWFHGWTSPRRSGESRGPTIVLAYLISEQKTPLADALRLLTKKRATVRPNNGFVRWQQRITW